MLSHLWLKNRSIVSRWKIDYAKLNKHRFLARVQMSLHHCAKAAARGDEARRACREGERVVFALLHSLYRPWCLPSSVRGLSNPVVTGVVGEMSMVKPRREQPGRACSPALTPPLPLRHLALEIWPYMGP